MRIFEKIDKMQAFLTAHNVKNDAIGFVPTMGALHQGHISLIKRALVENEVVVCSIFVNPTQFNKQEDLDNYPRTLEEDLKKLEQAGCHVAFVPSVAEMYPKPDNRKFDFGDLEHVMEGEFRPGHFNGVGVVVSKLLEIVKPHRAYFGQKDFQQLAVIRKLVKLINSPVEVIGCPTMREDDGLAMSSRNLRLSADDRKHSLLLYQALTKAKQMADEGKSPDEIRGEVKALFDASQNVELEYFEIANSETLQPVTDWKNAQESTACIAAWLNGVRLIDNMTLFP